MVKKPVEAPPKKKFYVNDPVKATKKSQQPAQQAKIIAPKPRIAKVAKVIAAVEEPKKKKIKFVVKKTPGEKLTGLTPAEMNKMSPEQLFGMLPVALAKKVLDPKTTGVQVGREKIGVKDFVEKEFIDLRDEYRNENSSDSKPNMPKSYGEDVTDLFLQVRKFLGYFKNVVLGSLKMKSSKKDLVTLANMAKRKKVWSKPSETGFEGQVIVESPKDIWNKATGDFMIKIRKLQKTEEVFD